MQIALNNHFKEVIINLFIILVLFCFNRIFLTPFSWFTW